MFYVCLMIFNNLLTRKQNINNNIKVNNKQICLITIILMYHKEDD